MRRVTIAAGVVLCAAALWWLVVREAPPAAPAGIVVTRGAVDPASRAPARAPAPLAASAGVGPDVVAQILADAGEPGAQLHDVRLVGERGQIACGRKTAAEGQASRPFVWLRDAHIVAMDGSVEYAHAALLCQDGAIPGAP